MALTVIETALPGVILIEPVVFKDDRGFFLESYHRDKYREIGLEKAFVQDNHSHSQRGTLRGLHFQLRRPQAKLVYVVTGEIFDVAVDIRQGSPTFGRWVGTTLSADNKRQILVPEGFAHGFYVMSEVAEFEYKCSNFYAPPEERGIIWNDPDIAIKWPLENKEPILSKRDVKFGTLATRPREDLPAYRS